MGVLSVSAVLVPNTATDELSSFLGDCSEAGAPHPAPHRGATDESCHAGFGFVADPDAHGGGGRWVGGGGGLDAVGGE